MKGAESTSDQSYGLGVVFPTSTWYKRDTPWITGLALVSLSRLPAFFSNLDPRNILPEPFDIPDHVGNTAITFALLHQFANGYWGKHDESMTQEEYERKRKTFAVAIGVTTVAMNIFAELVGYGKGSTPDIIDFVYGCVGGALAYKAKKPIFLRPSAVEYELKAREEDDPFRQRIALALAQKQNNRLNQATPKPKKNDSTSKLNYNNKSRPQAKMQRKSRRDNRSRK